MGIYRFSYPEGPSGVLGKSDYEAFYSGTLQQGDDLKIPVKTKAIDVYVNKLDVVLQSAQSGVTVDYKCYKNGSLLGTVSVTSGTTTGTTTISKTLITAGDKITWTITWTGEPTALGMTASMYARVTT